MLSYGEAETLLATIYKATGKAQTGAFRARLKHLKRLGIPLGSNPGRGKKIYYERNELYQWCFCIEMEEFGIDPSIITNIVKKYWEGILVPAFNKVRQDLATDIYFCFAPEFASAGWKPPQEFQGISAPFGFRSRDDLPDMLNVVSHNGSRLSLFNVTDRVREIEKTFAIKEASGVET